MYFYGVKLANCVCRDCTEEEVNHFELFVKNMQNIPSPVDSRTIVWIAPAQISHNISRNIIPYLTRKKKSRLVIL